MNEVRRRNEECTVDEIRQQEALKIEREWMLMRRDQIEREQQAAARTEAARIDRERQASEARDLERVRLDRINEEQRNRRGDR